MTRARLATLAAAAAALLAAAPAPAQERPTEADLFGAPPPTPTPQAAPTTPPPATPTSDDRATDLLGARDRPASDGRMSAEKDDPLKVGGLVYMRAATTWSEGVPPARWALSSPNLVDVFLDTRPNDRVRGFVMGRLTHDPTVATQATDPITGQTVTQPQTRAALDQLYVKLDVERTVFVTAGKQHVKWGTGRFWNPTDFLHPSRRDPLSQYDDRSGVTMLKAHLPWERHGWNFYAMTVLEDLAGQSVAHGSALEPPRATDPGALGHVGVGGRAEIVLGSVELAADAVAQGGHHPRFGLDGSFALWELDFHGELALTSGRDAPYWSLNPGGDPHRLTGWRRGSIDRTTPQVVAGVDWTWKYSDEDSLTVGGEYFYNDAGYPDAHVYPVLLFSPYLPAGAGGSIDVTGTLDPRTAFTPFYLGRHYAALTLQLPKPGSWNDTTFTLSVLGNLSDKSGVARLDHSVVINTWLTLETYLAGHFGTAGGELRFKLDVPDVTLGARTITLARPPPVLDAGVALRVKL